MDTKIVEIRDCATCIPALAIRLSPAQEVERALLTHSGYGKDHETQANYILLIPLVGLAKGTVSYNPFTWKSNRTLHEAHLYLIDHFEEVQVGDVIDVQYILGETQTRKQPDRLFDHPAAGRTG